MLTFHILNVYVDKTQPRQFKFTFNISFSQAIAQFRKCSTIIVSDVKESLLFEYSVSGVKPLPSDITLFSQHGRHLKFAENSFYASSTVYTM